jgi:hypothetical protein
MNDTPNRACTVFHGTRRLAAGGLAEVAAAARRAAEHGAVPVLIFDDLTGEQIDVDFRATAAEVGSRVAGEATGSGSLDGSVQRRPGRPKLGVVAREVTLLPRHWDWLNGQPGGASVALRKLVEEARRVHAGRDRVRQSQEAAYRFMSAMAGNLPGFEEATRALFAGRRDRFEALVASWPADIGEHARRLAAAALASPLNS